MTAEKQTCVCAEDLQKLVAAILEACNVRREDALVISAHLVTANLKGVETHGVVRLKGYTDRIEAGGNNPKPDIRIVRETPIIAVVDGDNSLGQVGGHMAMELAIKKAEKQGIGMVAMKNSNHYGMAAYYSMMPLTYDMIGISMTNVLACMAPAGGVTPMIGNDPISIAFPTWEEPPVVLDIATSKSSWGKALVCKQKGEPLPEDCFLDMNGNPTLDPDAFLNGGTLLPIAGHKGYGLALTISIMCGLLSDGLFDTDLPHLYKEMDKPGGNSFLMLAMKIDSFIPADHFKQRLDETVRMIRSTKCAQGIDRVYLPGEIEHETERQRREHGIPLNQALASELKSLARRASCDPSVYRFLQ